MILRIRKQPSLRYSITLTAGTALICVSIVLIAYAEIRSATKAHRQRLELHKIHVALIETSLNLKHEQLANLAKRVVSNAQVDAALFNGAENLETVLDIARENLPVVLTVTAVSGEVLATSIDRSVTIDGSLFSVPEFANAGTRLLVGSDGAPALLHHALIRRGQRVVGHVWVLLPIANVTAELFPDLAGLAFRGSDNVLMPLSGHFPVARSIEPGVRTVRFSETFGKRFEALFVPLRFDDVFAGELVFLKENTAALAREELFSTLAYFTVFVVILISLGLLARALRLGFRPLGAIVQLLEAMSGGNTGLRYRHAGTQSLPVSGKSENQKTASENSSRVERRPHREISTLLSTVESVGAAIDANNALIAVREQLENARRIQQSLLPGRFDLHPRLDAFGYMRPALDVAGDFLDIFRLDDARIAVLVADVSGKGLAPALFAAQASAILRANCHQTQEPEEVVRLTNQALCERNPEDMFLTCILMIVAPESGAVYFVNAGHCPPVIFRFDGQVEQAVTDPEPVLGVAREFTWTTHRFDLKAGDRLLLYSDGFDEAHKENGDMLGTARVIKMFSEACSSNDVSSKQLADGLFDGIAEFAAGAPQADDITILTIRLLN